MKTLKTIFVALLYYIVSSFLSLWILASINLASIFGVILILILPLFVFLPTIFYILTRFFDIKLKE